MNSFKGKRLLLLCDLDVIGRDLEVDQLIAEWTVQKSQGVSGMEDTCVGLVTRSPSEFFTKSYARRTVWLLNAMGATIIGRPLVELLPNFENFMTWKKTSSLSLEDLAASRIVDLAKRLLAYEPKKYKQPKLVVIHSSDEKTSNTLALWRQIQKELIKIEAPFDIQEVYIKRGSITDCIGCKYEICISEAKKLSCVLGGQFVDEVMPAIDSAHVIMWICPNYNDTIGGDLVALINRMSGFYRTRDLSEKKIYSVIVSGNSGTDSVASQLIGSLVLNKGFALPPYFCLTEIAGDPLSILEKPSLESKTSHFAHRLIHDNCE